MHVGYKNNKGVKDNFKVLGLNNWKETFAMNGGRKDCEELCLNEGESGTQF